MNRRSLIKNLGVTLGAAFIAPDMMAQIDEHTYSYTVPENPNHRPMAKAITAITLGAGNRGNVYGGYAAAFPDQLDIIGVAEPNVYRNEKYSKTHQIKTENRFNTWEDVFKQPKFADAVIIS